MPFSAVNRTITEQGKEYLFSKHHSTTSPSIHQSKRKQTFTTTADREIKLKVIGK